MKHFIKASYTYVAVTLFLLPFFSAEIARGSQTPQLGTTFYTNGRIAHDVFMAKAGITEGAIDKVVADIAAHKVKETFTANVSAYTAAADECGKSDGITASGKKVAAHRTLACPQGYVFGTKVHIEGYGTYTCEDRGGAIKGNKFDIYMQTKSEAFAFGRQNLTAHVLL